MDIENFGSCPLCPNGGECHCAQRCNSSPTDCLEGYPLAMVYSPCQHFEKIYEAAEALARGTLFMALDMPFSGGGNEK